MDKNQALGFVLMALLLMVYFWFFAPKPVEPSIDTPAIEEAGKTASAPRIAPLASETGPSAGDSARQDALQAAYGEFAPYTAGQESEYALENDQVRIVFSSRGGMVKTVQLKEYDDHLRKPLYLIDDRSSRMGYTLNTRYGEVAMGELFFSPPEAPEMRGDTAVLTFRMDLGAGRSIVQQYLLPPQGYTLVYRPAFRGLTDLMKSEEVGFSWHNRIRRVETDLEYSRYYTTVHYYLAGGKLKELKPRSTDRQEASAAEPVNWFSFKQKFFTAGLVFNRPIQKLQVSSQVDVSDSSTVKECDAQLQLPLAQLTGDAGDFRFYFGPNRLRTLRDVAPGFTENLYLGWPVIDWINQYVIITLFNFLERYFSNYGLIIIILVIIIKLVLTPLTYKSHMSMAKTKALKPELDALKEQYGEDMQKLQSEQMKLYQQVGVNPLSGCIPMLLQMPILFAMFQFIPHAIELRQKAFLWSDDLSTYDSILNLPFSIPGYGAHVSLFTLLMTLSTILYTYMNAQITPSVQGPMKTMQYIMPIVFLFVLNKFPAGLTFYYFVSNIVSFGQLAIIRRFVDDDKIRAILEENKRNAHTRKKSKFQQRLEDALKASEETKKTTGSRKPRK
jgi:YidC/Oxa1 family membrane protein insertase